MSEFLSSKWAKRVVFSLCLVPFLLLVLESLTGNLGINPVETLQHTTGDWALRFLRRIDDSWKRNSKQAAGKAPLAGA